MLSTRWCGEGSTLAARPWQVVVVVVVAVVDVVVLDDVVGSIELLVVIGIYAPLWSILKPSSKE